MPEQGIVELWHARRRTLRRVPDRGRIVSLRIFDSAVESLAGLEEMAALEELRLEGVRVPELASLRALPRLRHLTVDVRGVEDYTPISDLFLLESLELRFDRADEVTHLEEVDFGRLAKLRSLTLIGDQPIDIGRLTDLRFLGELRQLRELKVAGLRPHDKGLDFLYGLTELRRLELLVTSEGRLAHLRERLPHCELDIDLNRHLEHAGGGPDLTVGVVELWGPDEEGGWSIFQDLVAYLRTETNHDAERIVRRALRERDGSLVRRLDFDSEADGVGIYAHDERDARAVAEVIDGLAGERA